MADHILVMSWGCIEQVGTPAKVYHPPATAFVQRFIGVTNVLEGIVVADSQVQTAAGMLRCETLGLRIAQDVHLVVRAEDLEITMGGTGEIQGIVARNVYTGGGLLYIDVGQRFLKVRSLAAVQPGQHVTLTVVRPLRCLPGEVASGQMDGCEA